MWKKTETTFPQETELSANATEPVEQLRDRAMIGPSIFIRGDISGDEDLMVHGRIEGKIELKQHNVTVGKNGRVKADIIGKIISVEGEVQGNLYGEDKIIIRHSGSIRGNITSPRVNLEDGSKFKGSIDMDSPQEKRPPQPEAPLKEKPTKEEPPQKIDLNRKVNPTASRV